MINVKDLSKRLFFVFWAIPVAWIIVNSQIDLTQFLPFTIENLKPIYPVSLLTVALVVGAALEYYKMLATEYPVNRFGFMLFWLIPALSDSFTSDPLTSRTGSIYLLLIMVALEAFIIGKGVKRWRRASLLFSGTIFMYIAGTSVLNFFEPSFMNLWNAPAVPLMSNIGFVFIVTAIFICDSFAYFAGSLWGKTHFSSISPKKTVEGAIGGLIGSIIVMSLGVIFFGSDSMPHYIGPVLGLVIGVFAQVGDLTVSLMKRYFDVKDTSNLIPGHGGILDRFDSLFFTIPIVQVILSLVIKLS